MKKLFFIDYNEKVVEIFNFEGKIILIQHVTHALDVSFLPGGIYLVRIKSEKEKIIVSKLVKL